MTPPRVFISYSYDGPAHEAWVERLATDLRQKGVDALLDKWKVGLGGDLAAFMEHGLTTSDRVVLVCSDPYVVKADRGAGGVGYEKMIVTRELIANLSTEKFIPLLRNNTKRTTPVCLGTRKYIDFNDDTKYDQFLEDLLRTIHNAPRVAEPSIGPNPFATSAITTSAPAASPRPDVFADAWFMRAQAEGLHKVQTFGSATFELSFGATLGDKSINQRDLLEAVRRSGIHTFGWPIGVVLDQVGKRPVPTDDGIRAEVEHAGFSDTSQMDFWQCRKNGDFYLAHNLFEDRIDPTSIFFDTQVIRVAESLLFCRNLFGNLGYPSSTELALRIRHSGVRGRVLSTGNPNRMIGTRRVASVDVVETPIRFNHVLTDDQIAAATKHLLDPFFVTFDYFQLADSVYEQIVKDFIAGRVK